jgi:hypothetical protein
MHTVDNEASSYTSPILGSLSLSALYLLLVFVQRKVEILIQMMMALGSLITSHFLLAIDLLLATNIVVDLAAQVDGSSTVIARGTSFPIGTRISPTRYEYLALWKIHGIYKRNETWHLSAN